MEIKAETMKRCELLSVSGRVDSFGTGHVDDENLTTIVRELWDLTPNGIISGLKLRRGGVYRRTAAYGHFGRNEDAITWERTDAAERLRAAF